MFLSVVLLVTNNIYRLYQKVFKSAIEEASKQYSQALVESGGIIGADVRANGKLTVTDKRALVIGTNVQIDDRAYIEAGGGVVIGDNTYIGHNVSIYSVNHDCQGRRLPYDDRLLYKPVVISANVWIGKNVSIVPGVHVGEGAVISMGSVVTEDVASYSVVGGNPAKEIGTRDNEHYERLKTAGAFSGPSGKPYQPSRFTKAPAAFQDEIFFVLGTGRSGSEAISKIISSLDNCCCLHEPYYPVISLVTKYAHGRIGKEKLMARLRTLFHDVSFLKGQTTTYGESDQKYSFIIPVLREVFPKAKFIWLIRDPKSFLASSYPRGWFDDSEFGGAKGNHFDASLRDNLIHARNRLNGGLIGSMNEKDWLDMDPFERNCWYWNYCNSVIQDDLANISDTQKMFLKLQDLNNAEKLTELFSFLGVDAPSTLAFKSRKENSSNKANYDRYPFSDWTEDNIRAYEKWCSRLEKEVFQVSFGECSN